MPANLTPQYLDAERRFKEAQTPAEKVEALREMLAVVPKHKGTEKLRADLRRRLSRLHGEAEAERQRRAGGRPSPGHVPREGAGQIVLLGPPNAGKSSLLGALTHAHPKIAPYPFTTHEPACGMMDFEDVQVQLVDAPPVSAEFMEPWMLELLRNADRALLVADLGSDAVLEDIETVHRRLAERRLRLFPAGTPAPEADDDEAVETLVAANQADRPGAGDRLALLGDFLGDLWGAPPPAVVAVSATTGAGLDALRSTLFQTLDVVRIYTKMPGHKVDTGRPFVLPRGATVTDLAEHIHRDLARTLRAARIWGSGKFDGQAVHHDHVLADRDIVELHT